MLSTWIDGFQKHIISFPRIRNYVHIIIQVNNETFSRSHAPRVGTHIFNFRKIIFVPL